MEVKVYSKNLELLGVVDEFESVIWTSKYNEIGTVKMLAPLTQNNKNLLQISNVLVKENSGAFIQYVAIQKDLQNNNMIEVEAQFVTSLLKNRVLLEPVSMTDTPSNAIARIVRANLGESATPERKLENLLLPNMPVLEEREDVFYLEQFTNLFEAIQSIEQNNHINAEIVVEAGKYQLSIHKSENLTSGSEKPCIFSKEYDNILSLELTEDALTEKNVAYVQSDGCYIEVGFASGIDRKEIYFEKENDIAEYTRTLNLEAEVDVAMNLVFKVDFNLGDIVSVMDKELGIVSEMKIVEVEEIYESNEYRIRIIFGDSITQTVNRLRGV